MQHCDCLDEPPVHHFNGLSPEIAELMALLAEECGEVTQRVGKILRHGMRVNPYDLNGATNGSKLEDELTDVFAIASLLSLVGVISYQRLLDGIGPKFERLRRPDILHHSSLLRPIPCSLCGSITRIQTDLNIEAYGNAAVRCVDSSACMAKCVDDDKPWRPHG